MLNIAVSLSLFRNAIAESPSFAEFVFGQLNKPLISEVDSTEGLRIANAIVNNLSSGNKIAAIKILREVFSGPSVQSLRARFPERISRDDTSLGLASAKFIVEALRSESYPW